MSVTIRIPTPLRKFTGDKDVVTVQGKTVKEAIDHLVKEYPELKSQILDQNGEIRRFVNMFLNDRDIRFLGGVNAELKEGDQLAIIPAIAGGGTTLALGK